MPRQREKHAPVFGKPFSFRKPGGFPSRYKRTFWSRTFWSVYHEDGQPERLAAIRIRSPILLDAESLLGGGFRGVAGLLGLIVGLAGGLGGGLGACARGRHCLRLLFGGH